MLINKFSYDKVLFNYAAQNKNLTNILKKNMME
jgi:hypothetical protein